MNYYTFKSIQNRLIVYLLTSFFFSFPSKLFGNLFTVILSVICYMGEEMSE